MKRLIIGLVAILLAQVGFAQQTTKILNATTGVISTVNREVLPDIDDPVVEYYVDMFEAISIAKSLYGNRTDVDYYIANTGCRLINDPYTCDASNLPVSDTWVRSNYHWLIFVDEAPGKNWSHECGYVYVQCQVQKPQPIRRCKIAGKMFPYNKSFTKVDNINRYDTSAGLKPNVASSSAGYNAEVAGRTYALLLGCASNQYENYERLWNDCSYIYQVLNRKYKVPKSHIYSLIANGADVGPDVAKADGSGYMQSNCDLDGDHIDEVELPAEITELDYVISQLQQTMTANDQLLVFVTGNAGYSEELESYYLRLWPNERLYSQNLAQKFNGFNARAIHFVFGQSMAAGFAENFTGKGRIVTASCSANEATASCADKPYTEFLYNWTSAVNGADIAGNAVNADTDNNGRVTIEEAFQYANSMTTASSATLGATNRYLREDLALNNIPEAVDLYIRDNIGDTGKEPNTTTEKYWNSPDIWFRNSVSGSNIEQSINEPIIVNVDNPFNHVYVSVRITNRGQDTYYGHGLYLHLYWTNMVFDIDLYRWLGVNCDRDKNAIGQELVPNEITETIAPGASVVHTFEITLPKKFINLLKKPTQKFGINVMAKISNTDQMGNNEGEHFPVIRDALVAIGESNDIAQKSRVQLIGMYKQDCDILVSRDSTAYEYRISPEDSILFNTLEMSMELSPASYNLWKSRGEKANDVTVYASNPRKFYFNSQNSYISDVVAVGNLDSIRFSYNVVSSPAILEAQNYSVHIERRDQTTGKIISGTEVCIFNEARDAELLPIISSDLENGSYILSETNINDDATYQWYDDDNNLVANGKSVQMDASTANGTYKLRVESYDGVVNYAFVNVENIPLIDMISPNPFSDSITISLSRPANTNTIIQINGITAPSIHKEFNMHAGENQMNILTSNYPSGSYLVSVIENGKVLDTKQIVK